MIDFIIFTYLIIGTLWAAYGTIRGFTFRRSGRDPALYRFLSNFIFWWIALPMSLGWGVLRDDLRSLKNKDKKTD